MPPAPPCPLAAPSSSRPSPPGAGVPPPGPDGLGAGAGVEVCVLVVCVSVLVGVLVGVLVVVFGVVCVVVAWGSGCVQRANERVRRFSIPRRSVSRRPASTLLGRRGRCWVGFRSAPSLDVALSAPFSVA